MLMPIAKSAQLFWDNDMHKSKTKAHRTMRFGHRTVGAQKVPFLSRQV
jgi:hypothetical protein